MAAAGEPRPHGGIGNPLHDTQCRGGGDGVFKKPQRAVRPQHAAGLGKGGAPVGQRAHHQAQHGSIGAVVRKWKLFGTAGDDGDRERRGRAGTGSEPTEVGLGLDREDLGDGGE
jgi:hypothetical protein